MSTLSVEISSSGSSTATSSPTSLSHRVTVPSVTDSPSSGRVTVVPLPPDFLVAAAGFSVSSRGLSSEPDLADSGVSSPGGRSPVSSATSSSCSAFFSASSSSAGCASGVAVSSASLESSESPLDSPSSPITARSAPTSTVSSSSTLISSSVPATGLGISVSTLSVEISSSGSSTETVSPTCLSQRVTVPSVTDSPSSGRLTSVANAVPSLAVFGGVLGGAGVTGVPGSRLGARHECACSALPARARWASPRASFWVGWACTSGATSSACASQP